MVPVLPFSVFFAAIVSAQLGDCYVHTRSMGDLWVCGAPGPIKPPELSVRHFYPPDMELNADIIGIDRKEVRKPRVPPYTVRITLSSPKLARPIRMVFAPSAFLAAVARTSGTASPTPRTQR